MGNPTPTFEGFEEKEETSQALSAPSKNGEGAALEKTFYGIVGNLAKDPKAQLQAKEAAHLMANVLKKAAVELLHRSLKMMKNETPEGKQRGAASEKFTARKTNGLESKVNPLATLAGIFKAAAMMPPKALMTIAEIYLKIEFAGLFVLNPLIYAFTLKLIANYLTGGVGGPVMDAVGYAIAHGIESAVKGTPLEKSKLVTIPTRAMRNELVSGAFQNLVKLITSGEFFQNEGAVKAITKSASVKSASAILDELMNQPVSEKGKQAMSYVSSALLENAGKVVVKQLTPGR